MEFTDTYNTKFQPNILNQPENFDHFVNIFPYIVLYYALDFLLQKKEIEKLHNIGMYKYFN